ncbi:hypothetical protein NQ317_018606 [Molorchus minor]|uniref:Uncharacterized protein n=1 Tax=Molorchus minor TaxID=1323400 RepID=A0ABQ9JHD0_9CUCU|nr:hypothetical protein NQ317_018606 [Molorchus minor]
MGNITIFTIFGLLMAVATAQRPFYAGSSPIGFPIVGNRFKEPESTGSGSSFGLDGSIANRVGEGDKSASKIPVDALGDENLVKRISQWPREHQPFWYLNADHLESQRHPEQRRIEVGSRGSFNEVRTIRPRVPPRSPFLGLRSRR